MRSPGLGAKTVFSRRVRLKAGNCLIELSISGLECQTASTLTTLAQISWKSTPASKSPRNGGQRRRAAAAFILDVKPAAAILSLRLGWAKRNWADEQVSVFPSRRSARIGTICL